MLKETAELLTGKKKVILVHGNADMDAIGSAYAISVSFPDADIYAPGGLDRVAKVVSEKLGIVVHGDLDLSDYELVVVVDTSSPEQFAPGNVTVPENTVVIDHHRPTGKWNVRLVCDDTKVSCVELVYDIIRSVDAKIDRNVGLAMLSGMLTDSGRFQYADPKLMHAFGEIMDSQKISMDEVFSLTNTEQNMSERVAVMKSIGRTRFDRIGDMIVAVADGRSYESSACKALLSAGADVAFVASQRDDGFRLSARCTQEMVRRGIHLGEILKGLGEETETDGGGHGGAAGMSGTGDPEAMMNMCLKRTMDEFREIRRSFS